MGNLKTSSHDAFKAFLSIESAVTQLEVAKFHLKYSQNSNTYKAICEALRHLQFCKEIQYKVATNLLEEDNKNEETHLDDKNSHI